ncbi:MAG: hypothetical protein D6781_07400 [Verrucomicrobia bacterium]|nr:MAG: hypothetical protein D6781_07400 [Verrucomicrobiota bacterium]
MPAPHPETSSIDRRARLAWLAATALVTTGLAVAAARFPGGFDWRYDVVSALASRKYNPEGGPWFAVALALALACLWPVTTRLAAHLREGGRHLWPAIALRLGLIGGILVGIERAVFFHLSSRIHQAHEIVAFVAFVFLFAGQIGAFLPDMRERGARRWVAVALLIPLVGAGTSELLLFLDQRDVGWADFDWRATGLPVWLSFAFWQWLAVGLLWLGVFALASLPPSSHARTRQRPHQA